MSTFQFSMQKILDLKEKNKQQQELDFSKISKLLNQEKDKLNRLLEEQNQLQAALAHLHQIGASILSLNENQTYLTYLDSQIQAQQLQIAKIKTSLKNKQQELVEVKIEMEKWVKLRENKYQEFMLTYNQQEQKEIDEIASNIMFR